MRVGQGWCWRGLRASCACISPPPVSVFSALGFRFFPKDPFALVRIVRTMLASLALHRIGSFLPYGGEDFGM